MVVAFLGFLRPSYSILTSLPASTSAMICGSGVVSSSSRVAVPGKNGTQRRNFTPVPVFEPAL